MQSDCKCPESISHTTELCEVCAYEYNQWAEERAQEDALSEAKGITPEVMYTPSMLMPMFDALIGNLKEAA